MTTTFAPSKWHSLGALLLLIVVAAGVRLPGLLTRSIGMDEATTLLLTTGRFYPPPWPKNPAPASALKKQFFTLSGNERPPDFGTFAEELKKNVHPPLYFWMLSHWRWLFGFSLETARAFSLLCSLGTILALYALLQAANLERPVLLTLVYAVSNSAVYYGYEARPYALASLLVMVAALFSYLALDAANRDKLRAVIYSVVTAACCGAAFLTHYLAIFPLAVIALWSLMSVRLVSRATAVGFAILFGIIGLVWYSTIMVQLNRIKGIRGFAGIATEVKEIIRANLGVIWVPRFDPRFLSGGDALTWLLYGTTVLAYGVLIILAGVTLVSILRHWSGTNRRVWLLLAGLALAPSLGVFAVDLVFDKHLHRTRYLLQAGPALSVILAYGMARLVSSRRGLAIGCLATLLAIQLTGIDWGFDDPRSQVENQTRRAAKVINDTSLPSRVVAIRAYYGYGPALIYELNRLDPQTMILIVGRGSRESDLEGLRSSVQGYDDAWIVGGASRPKEWIILSDYLETTGYYKKIYHDPADGLIHLRKIDGS